MADETKKETTLEIKDVMAIIRRRKWLLIIPFILVTIIAFGGSYFLQERFQSSTMVVIDQTKFLSKQLQAMVPGQDQNRLSDVQRKNRLIALRNEIISSSYLTRLIDELGLFRDPAVVRAAQKSNLKRPDVPVERLVYYTLIERLRKNIKIEFNGEDIIQITAESSEPAQAMQIATKLAEIFKDERLKRELSGVRGALDFSDEQMAIYRKNLDDAESAKAQFASEYLRNQLDESVTADTNIRSIMADIDNIQLLIDNNIREQTRVRTLLSSYSKSTLTFKTTPEYERLTKSINTETQRLATFMSKYTWSDPKVLDAGLQISREMQNMERLIADQVRQQFTDVSEDDLDLIIEFFTLQSREMILRDRLNTFQVALSGLRNQIAKAPQYEIQMRNLENEVNSARMVYEKFKEQLTGSEISQSLMRGEAESKYRIMEPASVPLDPVKPNRIKIAMMGAILGLVIGGGAALLAELMDNSFKKVEDVEEYLHAPVLAAIPAIESIKGKVKVG